MGTIQNNRVIFAVITVSITVVGIYIINEFRKRRLHWIHKFIEVGKVKELFLYPIKSTKSLNVKWMDCLKNGGQFNGNKDRHFLIVDEKLDHLFLRGKQYPKMVLIESEVKNNILIIRIPNENSIKVNLEEVENRNDIRNAILHFKQKQEGFDCGDKVGEFLGNFLETKNQRNLRLLYFKSGLFTERNYTTNSEFWLNPVPILSDSLAYQDLSTYMLTTEASVDDLNERLSGLKEDKCKVSTRNFRPNISIEGTKPFDEDWWNEVKIGEAIFACYRPCSRCIFTTVDPDKGYLMKNMQPLRLLRTYRLAPKGKLRNFYGESPIFGVYMILKKEGRINVGDKVFVRKKVSPF